MGEPTDVKTPETHSDGCEVCSSHCVDGVVELARVLLPAAAMQTVYRPGADHGVTRSSFTGDLLSGE